MSTRIPEEILEPLKALLKRVRRMQTLRGVAGVVTVMLGGLLVMMAADFLFAPLSGIARWILLGALLIGTLASIWAWLLKPLRRHITLVQVARWLETRHPEIEERVSTALELSGKSGTGVSESLLAELVQEAQGDIKRVDPEIEVRSKRVQHWMWPAGALAALFLLLFALFPGEARRLFVRAIAPFTDLGNAGAVAFTIEPKSIEVLEGDEVKIGITFSSPKAKELTLVMEREGKETLIETIEVSRVADGLAEFEYNLPAARESFHYFARIGKAQSDGFDVTVWPLPQLEDLTVEFKYPAYTNLPTERRSLGRGVAALAGTEVELTGTTFAGVQGGRFVIDGTEVGAVSAEVGAGESRVEANWTLQAGQDGVGRVMLQHRLGREIEGARFAVKAVPDQVPVVTILTPAEKEMRIRPNEDVRLEYEVTDDVGVRGAAVQLQVNGSEVDDLAGKMPERDEMSAKPGWIGEEVVALGPLLERYEDAQEVKMRVAVSDVLPELLGGPGVGYSDWRVLVIDREAESLVRQEIRAQQSDVRETLREAVQDVQEAAQRMDEQREELMKDELTEQAMEALQEARAKLAEAQEELGQLAERMERGVQAARADEVRQGAQQVAESRQRLEDTPLQDTAEGREEELRQAREAAQQAIEQLQEVQEAVQRDEGKLEQVARLAELAQQEKDIARRAEQTAREDGLESPADQALQREQEQVEESVESEVNENQEAKAEMLGQQAEAAAALAEEARELAERQDDLAAATGEQAPAEDGEPPNGAPEEGQPRKGEGNEGEAPENGAPELAESIREQLAAEQAEIVESAREQLAEARANFEERANFLPEAVDEAEEALQALENGLPEVAAEAAQAAAENLEEQALPSNERGAGETPGEPNAGAQEQGDAADRELEALAERQAAVAEAMEQLEAGKAEEALQALQNMQAGDARELAEAIANLPQLSEPTGAMNQASRQAEQGAREAGQAAESGQQGEAQAASQQHGQASQSFAGAADALQAAAEQFAQEAEQAAGQSPNPNQVPGTGKSLAEALEAAARASQAQSAGEQAETTQQAAQALAQAAREAMQAMQSGQQPGSGQPGEEPGQPGQEPGEPGGQPGQDPREGPRPQQGSPGVPPELAELGVSAKDWEKLKEILRSDVAGGAGVGVPEDYRSLVKRYFQEVAKGAK